MRSVAQYDVGFFPGAVVFALCAPKYVNTRGYPHNVYVLTVVQTGYGKLAARRGPIGSFGCCAARTDKESRVEHTETEADKLLRAIGYAVDWYQLRDAIASSFLYLLQR